MERRRRSLHRRDVTLDSCMAISRINGFETAAWMVAVNRANGFLRWNRAATRVPTTMFTLKGAGLHPLNHPAIVTISQALYILDTYYSTTRRRVTIHKSTLHASCYSIFHHYEHPNVYLTKFPLTRCMYVYIYIPETILIRVTS